MVTYTWVHIPKIRLTCPLCHRTILRPTPPDLSTSVGYQIPYVVPVHGRLGPGGRSVRTCMSRVLYYPSTDKWSAFFGFVRIPSGPTVYDKPLDLTGCLLLRLPSVYPFITKPSSSSNSTGFVWRLGLKEKRHSRYNSSRGFASNHYLTTTQPYCGHTAARRYSRRRTSANSAETRRFSKTVF